MRAKAIVYWLCSALVAFSFVSGGAVYWMRVPDAIEGVTRLGYPLHFILLLGFWKVLGGIVVLLPGFALAKEWAYAGMMFDLTGAAVAHVAMQSGAGHVASPLGLALLVIASWALRPDSRRLKRSLSQPDETAVIKTGE